MPRISLRGLNMLIWVDTLRRVHNVGFLVERFIYVLNLQVTKLISDYLYVHSHEIQEKFEINFILKFTTYTDGLLWKAVY